jgi:quercetin dioxygenase-like cupin family protein
MHAVIRRYQVDPANVEEIVRRARDGFVPVISKAPGLVSYSITDAGGGKATSLSVFETKEQAEASIQLAADWVREHLAGLIGSPTSITSGTLRVRVIGPAKPRVAVVRQYRADPGDVDEIVRRAEAGFVPLIEAAPGLARYAIVDAGGGEIVSLSAFETREQADRSTQLAADWVREHMAPFVRGTPEVTAGTVRVFAAPPPDDPVRVDPGHYQVVAENARVRVLRIQYAAGERSVMHSHPDHVAVLLSNGNARMHLPDGTTQDMATRAGDVILAPAGQHLPENLAREPLEGILIELKD